MKLPLLPKQAEQLRDHMWALLCLLKRQGFEAKRVSCVLQKGGSVAVERESKNCLSLSLRVDRATAYSIIRNTTDIKDLLDSWWNAFGPAMTEAPKQKENT